MLGLVDSFVRARVYLGVDYDVERIEGCVIDLLSHGLTSCRNDQVRGVGEQ